jgi:hypothetical protein
VVLLNLLCPYFLPQQYLPVHEKILHLIGSDCAGGLEAYLEREDGPLMDEVMILLHSGKISIKVGKPSSTIFF